MLRILDLPDDAARECIRNGDFPASVLGEGNTAVVMTQNWCPDWFFMKSWLKRMEKSGKPTDVDIDVYVLVYNGKPFFSEFMDHKEKKFGNFQIPYVRYYRSGLYVGESNQVRPGRFEEMFASS